MLTPHRALIAFAAVVALTAALATSGDATIADTAPSNTTAPAISGSAQEGSTLTASSGSWSGTTPITFTYAWERCDSGGSSCSAISSATSQTYTVASADVGHTLRVSVTATNSTGTGNALSDASDVVLAQGVPISTAKPVISGSTIVGSQLSVSNGSWSGASPFTYAYEWERCDTHGNSCSTIAGATSATYTVASADVGHALRAIVTATNSAGHAFIVADATSVVAAATAPTLSAAPAIAGTTTQGQTLTVSNGTWNSATTVTYTYQWERCDSAGNNCTNISGATSSKYVLTSDDVGHELRAKVTATSSAGSVSATTNPVGPVKSPTGGTGCVIAATSVASSDRLTVSKVSYAPSISHGREPVSATFTVVDANKCAVNGALVYVVGLPYNWMLKVPEVRTGANGQVTVTVSPTRATPRRGALVMFVRARTPQGDLLAGSSTRRLVQLLLRP